MTPKSRRMLFVDFDYLRGSHAHGRSQVPMPPEGWLVGRIGTVSAMWNGSRLVVGKSHLLDSIDCGNRFLKLVHDHDLVVGFSLLQSDLPALAMIAEVRRGHLEKCVDVLPILNRVRGKHWPTGLSLEKLAIANLSDMGFSKERAPVRAPHVWRGERVSVANRNKSDPRDDARLVMRLWETLVATRAVVIPAAGAGQASTYGPGWKDTPGDTFALATETVRELTGEMPTPERTNWFDLTRGNGGVLGVFPGGGDRARLAATRRLPASGRAELLSIHAALNDHGLIPAASLSMTPTVVLEGLQRVPGQQLFKTRESLCAGTPLTVSQRAEVAWGMWHATHRLWEAAYWQTVHDSKSQDGVIVWASACRLRDYAKSQKDELRTRIRAAIGGKDLTEDESERVAQEQSWRHAVRNFVPNEADGIYIGKLWVRGAKELESLSGLDLWAP